MLSHRAPRTGIPVEQPCPADLVGPLDDDDAQPELPQPMQGVQAGESGADDDRVEATLNNHRASLRCRWTRAAENYTVISSVN
jgi:hypothetical protein